MSRVKTELPFWVRELRRLREEACENKRKAKKETQINSRWGDFSTNTIGNLFLKQQDDEEAEE